MRPAGRPRRQSTRTPPNKLALTGAEAYNYVHNPGHSVAMYARKQTNLKENQKP